MRFRVLRQDPTVKSTHKILVHLICLTLFLYIISLLYRQLSQQASVNKEGNYDCQAVFTLEASDLRMPAVAGISVKDNKGVVIFGGPVYRDNIYIGSISRRVEFNYSEEYSCTAFKHCKTIKFEKDNVDNTTAKQILPGFFTASDSASYFRIHKVKDGVLFKKDNIPMFFCAYH